VKQHIVESDPFEKEDRKVLNFGHTIGHALESHFMSTVSPLSHGQAVTLGMLAETKMANRLGLLTEADFYAMIRLIHRLLLPAEVTLPSIDVLTHWIIGDKKKSDGRIGFSLPDRIGSCQWNMEVPAAVMTESLDWLATQVNVPSDRLKGE
jgi:3-dehydroquinate synthase